MIFDPFRIPDLKTATKERGEKLVVIPFFVAIAKFNQIPFRANCMRNLRIACNASNVGNITLGELNLK
jgi:hypothetical protein